MDYKMFSSFLCVALALLIGLQVYGHTYIYMVVWGPQDVDGGFARHVKELSKDLYEVNCKHVRLQKEMERICSVLRAVAAAAAAGRAKDAIEPSLPQNNGAGDGAIVHITSTRPRPRPRDPDYDRQISYYDYALKTNGAKIVDTGNTIEHMFNETSVSWLLHVLSTILWGKCQGARAMIQPGTLPGECWAFKGSMGEATIQLAETVRITAITIEHIPAHMSPTREISSAPRLIQLEGLKSRLDRYPHDFGTFEYVKEYEPIQYFRVLYPLPRGYNLVQVRVITNWGHPVYTCVYRVRVHGELETQSLKKLKYVDYDYFLGKTV